MIENEPGTSECLLAHALANQLDQHFEQLVLTYQDRLYAFALRLTGDRQDAEEVAQDTFLRSYQALTKYPQAQIRSLALRPWLYQIALNVFRNRVRRKRLVSVPLESDSESEMSFEPAASERERPEALVLELESQEQMRIHLAALPERQRVPIILRHIEGLSYTELATILQQPVGTVKANVHRGLLRLRATLRQAVTI